MATPEKMLAYRLDVAQRIAGGVTNNDEAVLVHVSVLSVLSAAQADADRRAAEMRERCAEAASPTEHDLNQARLSDWRDGYAEGRRSAAIRIHGLSLSPTPDPAPAGETKEDDRG